MPGSVLELLFFYACRGNPSDPLCQRISERWVERVCLWVGRGTGSGSLLGGSEHEERVDFSGGWDMDGSRSAVVCAAIRVCWEDPKE